MRSLGIRVLIPAKAPRFGFVLAFLASMPGLTSGALTRAAWAAVSQEGQG
jgi:hypothetical protein